MIITNDHKNRPSIAVLEEYAAADEVTVDKIFRVAVGVYQLYREGKLQFREELGGGCGDGE